MGTKQNPGAFDCHAKALPHEPLFTLLARDPFAPVLVRKWADDAGSRRDTEKEREARQCADAMEEWLQANPRPAGGYPLPSPPPARQSGEQASSIAGRLLSMSDTDMARMSVHEWGEFCTEVRTLAASVLAQDETPPVAHNEDSR